MVANPLPKSRAILERLYAVCTKGIDGLFIAIQLDGKRADLLRDAVFGDHTPEELMRRLSRIDDGTSAAFGGGVQSVVEAAPYMDPVALEIANSRIAFGAEAAADGNKLAVQNRWFLMMVAAAYDAAVSGNIIRFGELRRLQEQLRASLENEVVPHVLAPPNEKPTWNNQTGVLTFRGKVIRRVRDKRIAGRVHQILDLFQSSNWDDRISTPKGYEGEALVEALRSLNARLADIRFRAYESGEGIIWEEK